MMKYKICRNKFDKIKKYCEKIKKGQNEEGKSDVFLCENFATIATAHDKEIWLVISLRFSKELCIFTDYKITKEFGKLC